MMELEWRSGLDQKILHVLLESRQYDAFRLHESNSLV